MVREGGLGCFLKTAARIACRTTFRSARFAFASKLARYAFERIQHKTACEYVPFEDKTEGVLIIRIFVLFIT